MPAGTLIRPLQATQNYDTRALKCQSRRARAAVDRAVHAAGQIACSGSDRLSDDEALQFFRLAIAQSDPDAWETIVAKYGPLVQHWVRQHPSAAALHEDDQYWVVRSFERFWLALRPDRLDRFTELAAVLQYLKMCVHSVVVSDLRARAPMPALSGVEWAGADEAGANVEDPEQEVVDRAARVDFWRTVNGLLLNETERLLLYLNFVLGLPPREIQARAPEQFPSVADVYRVKRNVLERLRRSPRICAFQAA